MSNNTVYNFENNYDDNKINRLNNIQIQKIPSLMHGSCQTPYMNLSEVVLYNFTCCEVKQYAA